MQQSPAGPVPGRGGDAFAARCLLRGARSAVLATQREGQPHASLVTPATLPDGRVLMLLSTLAAHTRHLDAEPRCALYVQGLATGPNLQTAPRLSVTGQARRLADARLRQFWLARHPYAALYADFTDFALWCLVPEQGHFVGGFGRACSLRATELRAPEEAAGLADAAPALLARYAHHAAALAHAQGRHGRWQFLGLDADGIDMIQDETILRIAFDAPVDDEKGAEAALRRLCKSGG